MSNYTSQAEKSVDEKAWNAALYVRISKDDGDKEESDSITNQKALITEYVKTKPEIRICSERVDDGFSGVNFDRPAFSAMIEDIKAGVINCVIVKDLSRFGRNWVETGKYIENIFPYIGVRFIAINDNLDTLKPRTYSDNISVPFKNLMNDAYCRDISIKTKSQLDTKRRKGDFIGSFAVYGYMKDERNHNKLVIDEYAAAVVRNVFNWKLHGMSQQGIANKLNDMGVLSPMEYKREAGFRFSTGFKMNGRALWSSNAVARVLKNEIYLGILEQGKRTSTSYKVKNRVNKSKDEWIRVENTHEAIISTEEFQTVSVLLKQDVRIAPSEEVVYPFSGLLKCADCGRNMVRKTVPGGDKKYIYYVCAASKSGNSCSAHSISGNALEKAVLQSVKHHIGSILEVERILGFIETLPLKQLDVQKLDKQIQAKEKETLKYQERKTKLYEHFSDGVIDKAEYERLKTEFDLGYSEAEQAIFKLNKEIEDIINNRTDKHQWIEHFKEFQDINCLSRKIIVDLIDTIKVHENNRIDIKFKYQYSFDKAVNFIETVSSITETPDCNIRKGAV